MSTLRDAQTAQKDIGNVIGNPHGGKANIVGDALAGLDDRLSAVESIPRTLADKYEVSADDAVQARSQRRSAHQTRAGLDHQSHRVPPSGVEKEIRRILG